MRVAGAGAGRKGAVGGPPRRPARARYVSGVRWRARRPAPSCSHMFANPSERRARSASTMDGLLPRPDMSWNRVLMTSCATGQHARKRRGAVGAGWQARGSAGLAAATPRLTRGYITRSSLAPAIAPAARFLENDRGGWAEDAMATRRPEWALGARAGPSRAGSQIDWQLSLQAARLAHRRAALAAGAGRRPGPAAGREAARRGSGCRARRCCADAVLRFRLLHSLQRSSRSSPSLPTTTPERLPPAFWGGPSLRPGRARL